MRNFEQSRINIGDAVIMSCRTLERKIDFSNAGALTQDRKNATVAAQKAAFAGADEEETDVDRCLY